MGNRELRICKFKFSFEKNLRVDFGVSRPCLYTGPTPTPGGAGGGSGSTKYRENPSSGVNLRIFGSLFISPFLLQILEVEDIVYRLEVAEFFSAFFFVSKVGAKFGAVLRTPCFHPMRGGLTFLLYIFTRILPNYPPCLHDLRLLCVLPSFPLFLQMLNSALARDEGSSGEEDAATRRETTAR